MALIRRGHHGAFEALVQRYQPRLLAFCRHMLASREDAEDVLQEVFAAAFNAICADDRPINARPWLYRIARNRCLNHLRRVQPTGQDSMDVFERDGGSTTADTVHFREEFRQIVTDVGQLPETQRTALLLREIDALSYDQIAEAMDTTVPSVKSLLVRARVSLAEAAEARLLTCEEVRLELGAVAEGINRTSAPLRRHLKTCERCRTFRSEMRNTSKALAAVYPIGPLIFMKKLWIAKLSFGGAASAAVSSSGGAAGGAAAGGVAGAAAGGMAGAAGGITAGGAVSAGLSTIASKAAAGMAAAVIVTAGAVEVKNVRDTTPAPAAQIAAAQPAPAPAVAPDPPAASHAKAAEAPAERHLTARPLDNEAAAPAPVDPAAATPETPVVPVDVPAVPIPVQEDGSVVTLPTSDAEVLTDAPATEPTDSASEPAVTEPPAAPGTTPSVPPSAPPATGTPPAAGAPSAPLVPVAPADPGTPVVPAEPPADSAPLP